MTRPFLHDCPFYSIIDIYERQLRSLLISTLGHYGDKEVTKEAQTRFNQHMFGTIIHRDLRTSVYSICLSAGDSDLNPGVKHVDTFDKLEKVYLSLLGQAPHIKSYIPENCCIYA